MKHFTLYPILLLVFLLPGTVLAQKRIDIFADTSYKEPITKISHLVSDNEQFIYFAGAAFSYQNGRYPGYAIVKMDMEGRHIWTRTLNKEIDQGEHDYYYLPGLNQMLNYEISDILLDKDYLFVIFYQLTHPRIIYAIDIKTGRTVWIKTDWINFPETLSISEKGYLSYVTHSLYGVEYKLLDKHTGVLISNTEVGRNSEDVPESICNGKDGSVYFLKNAQLTRYTSPSIDSMAWTQTIQTPDHRTGPLIHGLRDLGDGFVYIYGSHSGFGSGFFVGRLRPDDGTISWLYQPKNNSDYMALYIADIKIKKDFIYFVLNNKTTTHAKTFHVVKINRATGAQEWDKPYNYKGGLGYLSESVGEGLYSIDADDAGNVYVSGAENNGSQPGQLLTVMKLDKDGNILYHRTLGGKSGYLNPNMGLFTHVTGNRVIHAGILNADDTLKAHIIANDTSNTFNPIFTTPVIAHHQEPGKVKKILPFSASKYAVFKQVGTHATLELRNSGNSKLIWSKDFAGKHFYQAGGLCVTKDNKIAVSVFSQDTSWVKSDYSRFADTIFFFSIDSTGHETYSSFKDVKGVNINTPLDLFVTNNNSIIMPFAVNSSPSSDDVGYIDNLLIRDNFTSDYMGYGNLYFPQEGPYKFVLPYRRDSLVILSNNEYTSLSFTSVGDTTREEKPDLGYGWTTSLKGVGCYKDCISIDSITTLLLTYNMQSGIASLIRYNLLNKTAEWSVTEGSGISLDRATLKGRQIYIAGQQDRQLLIRKMDVANGDKIWETKVPVTGENQYYVVADQAFNSQRQQYIICGHIEDSSRSSVHTQQPFYTIVDTAGNVLHTWIGVPDLEKKNQLNTIAVTQFGQTLLGGSLYTNDNHRAGIVITADDIIPSTEPETIAMCSGTGVTLDSYVSGNTYRWQVDKGTGYIDLADGPEVTGSNKPSLQLLNIPASSDNYRYRVVIDGTAGNSYRLLVRKAVTPTITVTGDTIVNVNTTGRYNTIITWGGGNPTFRWEDSTSRHTWTVIPDATGSTSTYQPAVMNSKLRCIMTSDAGCATTNTAVSNALPVHINVLTGVNPGPRPGQGYGITVSPNPASNTVKIQGLRPTDTWETLEVRTVRGTLVRTHNVRHQTSISIDVTTLSGGTYLLVLRSSKGEIASLQLLKL